MRCVAVLAHMLLAMASYLACFMIYFTGGPTLLRLRTPDLRLLFPPLSQKATESLGQLPTMTHRSLPPTRNLYSAERHLLANSAIRLIPQRDDVSLFSARDKVSQFGRVYGVETRCCRIERCGRSQGASHMKRVDPSFPRVGTGDF
ncbi:hypothetical protein FB45DRAFT_236006 [Roridomyces roridus]|uniref:Uncharacterized protein n=1 Tax=Roridomyces roridus TaxID=1738132 RepID=A0AAD7BBQ9_9AGAR|nr:hypothetical protein FB45DRAFT_236006 [Roridomyces roridus]